MKLFSVRTFPVFGLLFIVLIFFWPFLLKDRIPIPADTILGMYHPWRDKVWDGLNSGVPYKNFLITDPVRQTYIWKKLAIQDLKSLSLPLWNPYTHSGMPLMANFQTGAFYPLNFVFFLFPFNQAWGIFIAMQPLLAAHFMYLLLKKYELKTESALLGAITFAFGGFFTAWLEWGNIGHTLLWLPLIIFCLENLFENQKNKIKYSLILLFALISQFLAGHLQVSIYLTVFSLVYFLFSALSKNKIKESSGIIFVFFCFILITSIQWLPTLELILNSSRNIDISNTLIRPDWFLPFKHLIQLVIPDFFGNPATGNYWGEWNYAEFVSFIGIVPFIFLFVSLKNFKNIKIKFFWLSLITILSFALPTPWAKLPYIFNIPFLSTAQPSRLLSIVGFCIPVLAAFGLNDFMDNKHKNSTLWISLGTFTGLIFFAIAVRFNFLQLNAEQVQIAFRNLLLPAFISMVSLLVILTNNLIKKVSIYLLLILALFGFYRFFTKFTPFVKEEWIFPQTKTTEFLQKDQSLFRIMTTDRRVLPSNFAADYSLQSISGYDPLYLSGYAKLITKMESGKNGLANFQRIIEPANYSSEIADSLNVKYVISLADIKSSKLKKVFQEGETRIYQNLLSQPRVKLTSNDDKLIEISEYQSNTIKIKADSRDGGNLILSDMFYPGWYARINGKEVAVEESNENFREITLVKGLNLIEFSYKPGFFYYGLLMAVMGLLGTIFYIVYNQNNPTK